MTQKGSPKKGDVYNWDQIRDVTVNKLAASENLANGDFVYQDGANGLKKVPTTGVDANRIRFAPTGFNNASGSLGDREIESVKKGARVVGQCDGVIVVGDRVKFGATTAGRVEKLAKPANAALNAIFSDTEVEAEIDLVRDYDTDNLGIYTGHSGEMEGTANEPTDSADGDLVVIEMI